MVKAPRERSVAPLPLPMQLQPYYRPSMMTRAGMMAKAAVIKPFSVLGNVALGSLGVAELGVNLVGDVGKVIARGGIAYAHAVGERLGDRLVDTSVDMLMTDVDRVADPLFGRIERAKHYDNSWFNPRSYFNVTRRKRSAWDVLMGK